MTQYIVKIVVTAALVIAITEVSKRSSLLGGLLASLPLTSMLALVWFYIDTKDTGKVAALTTSIFWLVLPSLALFIALPLLLKTKLNFYAALGGATAIMLACYGMMLLLLRKFGINL
jgi:hypothetical protein